MYLIFLLLFSYVLLCDFYPIYQDPTLNPTLIATHLNIRISIIEVVVIVWVFSFIAESIRHVNLTIYMHNIFTSYIIIILKFKFIVYNLF